ncbi:unnamed protein product [Didymodactylos carnosus]|uniref:glycerol-3-phosphate dehydrogenase (NAD(+)) n=1 Tax=Didymodactylos carnosus TaxID=1234261 RepID=A0A813YSU9_9BILA|nr:unnamed protein product [Didymodactylos carnosus]CAF1464374.1 unnamed protein product [Didymodactylos carnosus]CAF3673250.1 unnamed protein product [Didymodactylos carnosus]CAF4257298.1 unnamed protein product [Didymodactylos carnosus]
MMVACLDVAESAKDADILLINLPHQLVTDTCSKIQDGIPCYMLVSADIADKAATGTFCDATIGSDNYKDGQMIQELFQTDKLKVDIKLHRQGVEISASLEDIVALAAGIYDGLSDKTKAIVIRIGLNEMIQFCKYFFNGHLEVIESYCIGVLYTSCYAGRNKEVGEALVKTGKCIKTLEEEMFNGQELQGPIAAARVTEWLKATGESNDLPTFERPTLDHPTVERPRHLSDRHFE